MYAIDYRVRIETHKITCEDYVPTIGACAAYTDGNAYIVGGRASGGTTLNTIFQFNVGSRTMSRFLPRVGRLPPLAYASASAIRGQILVFGGEASDGSLLNSLFVINLLAQSVDRVVLDGIPPTPRARHWAGLII